MVAPDRVLRELADLWVTLGSQGQAESGAGVLRACTLTLVVLAEAGDDATALGETIAALMPEHPARSPRSRCWAVWPPSRPAPRWAR